MVGRVQQCDIKGIAAALQVGNGIHGRYPAVLRQLGGQQVLAHHLLCLAALLHKDRQPGAPAQRFNAQLSTAGK